MLTNTNNYIQKELIKRWEKKLMRTIKQKLSSLHYRFENEAAFLKFSDERISRVFFEDDPYNHELRLDYKSIDEPGRLIVRFSTKAEMKCEPSGRVTLTIG